MVLLHLYPDGIVYFNSVCTPLQSCSLPTFPTHGTDGELFKGKDSPFLSIFIFLLSFFN